MNKKLDWSKENILAYEFDSKIDEEEDRKMMLEIEAAMQQYDGVRLFVKMPELAAPSASSMSERVKFLKEHDLSQIKKYAIVGDQKTLKAASKGADLLTGANIRHFNFDEEGEAKRWILEDD